MHQEKWKHALSIASVLVWVVRPCFPPRRRRSDDRHAREPVPADGTSRTTKNRATQHGSDFTFRIPRISGFYVSYTQDFRILHCGSTLGGALWNNRNSGYTRNPVVLLWYHAATWSGSAQTGLMSGSSLNELTLPSHVWDPETNFTINSVGVDLGVW